MFYFVRTASFASGKDGTMGFFDRIFGSGKEYPELDPSSPAQGRLDKFRTQLLELSSDVKQPLEVIPGDERAFVFIGSPPKKFGVAWVEEGKINNLKTLAEEKNVEPHKIQALAERLRKIYEANQQDERFSAKLGDRSVVVTPSDEFRMQIRGVIEEVVH
jgi:hypothetical protein